MPIRATFENFSPARQTCLWQKFSKLRSIVMLRTEFSRALTFEIKITSTFDLVLGPYGSGSTTSVQRTGSSRTKSTSSASDVLRRQAGANVSRTSLANARVGFQ